MENLNEAIDSISGTKSRLKKDKKKKDEKEKEETDDKKGQIENSDFFSATPFPLPSHLLPSIIIYNRSIVFKICT